VYSGKFPETFVVVLALFGSSRSISARVQPTRTVYRGNSLYQTGIGLALRGLPRFGLVGYDGVTLDGQTVAAKRASKTLKIAQTRYLWRSSRALSLGR